MKPIQPTLPRLEHSLNHRRWPWLVMHRTFGYSGDHWHVWRDWRTRTPYALAHVTPLAQALQLELIQAVQLLHPHARYHHITVVGVDYQVVDWSERLHRFSAEFCLY